MGLCDDKSPLFSPLDSTRLAHSQSQIDSTKLLIVHVSCFYGSHIRSFVEPKFWMEWRNNSAYVITFVSAFFLRVFLLGVLSFMIPVLRQLADIAQQMKLNRNKWLLNFCGRSFLIDHKNTLFAEYTQFEMKDFEIGAVFFLNTSFQPYMFSTLNDSFNEIVLLQTLFAIPTALTVSVDLSFRLHNVHSSIHSIYIYSNQ